MKKHIFTIALLALISCYAKAQTTHTVTCQNGTYHFLPVTVNAVVGDTIFWVWVSGVHVVGPISAADIPTAAAMWNCPIDASNLTCKYEVLVSGTYNYQCHPATPHGEPGYIVVSATAGIQQYVANNIPRVYPNPASSILNVALRQAQGDNVEVQIMDVLGNVVIHNSEIVNQKCTLDVSALQAGVYFIKTPQGIAKFVKE